MLTRIRQPRDGSAEHGFTIIEFLVVTIIIGILLAVAVPSYLGFRDRAANTAAKSHLESALPAADAYYSDKGTYARMNSTNLVAIDPGVSQTLTVTFARAHKYCLTDTVSGKTWSVAGPRPSGADYHASADCT